MASNLYDKAREKFLSAGINLLTATVKAVLIDANDYAVNFATHEFLSDIPAGARVATSPALTSKTVTLGVFNAASTTWASVTGDQSEAVVFIVDTGNATTSSLIAYIDSASSGLPVTPNGGDITLNFDTGTNKIFKL